MVHPDTNIFTVYGLLDKAQVSGLASLITTTTAITLVQCWKFKPRAPYLPGKYPAAPLESKTPLTLSPRWDHQFPSWALLGVTPLQTILARSPKLLLSRAP